MENRTGRLSTSERLAELPPDERAELIRGLSKGQAMRLLYDWRMWARPNQLPPPGDWGIWVYLAGRGSGKTRAGAEWVRMKKEAEGRGILVGRTASDLRDSMIEGESGILATAPPWDRPTFSPSRRRLTWPNGAICHVYSADEPDVFRGPQCHWFWADELASWRNLADVWPNLLLSNRLGANPQGLVTTTPRPLKLLRELLNSANVVFTRGTSYENRANLSPAYYERNIAPYEGTRLGRQEIHGDLLEDIPGALWDRAQIDALRVEKPPEDLRRVVVAVDPAVTSGEDADETGIIVVGQDQDDHGYVLADRSGRYSPQGWAQRAAAALEEFEGDSIVGEVNNGGDLVENTVRMVAPQIKFKAVRASRGKVSRAQPVATLYEQGRFHHVGTMARLEDQLCLFTPEGDFGASPDRADALVWGATELFVQRRAKMQVWTMGGRWTGGRGVFPMK